MDGREDGNEPWNSLRASLTVKNVLPLMHMKRNHMKTVPAWISRQRFESSSEPQAIQSPGMLLALMLAQLTTCSLAASITAAMKENSAVRPSNGTWTTG